MVQAPSSPVRTAITAPGYTGGPTITEPRRLSSDQDLDKLLGRIDRHEYQPQPALAA